MSLKAKIEAVIYAADEPVTLAQIAALFQAELLQERQARASSEADADGQSADEIDTPESDSSGTVLEEASGDSPVQEEASTDSGEPSISIAEEEKRAARQRDRDTREEARRIVAQLIADYAEADRGIEVREIAGGYRVATKPEYHDAVRGFIKSLKPPMKLSLQALETLAVIAYKQPVTAPEVSEIRGVDSAGVLGSLVSRKLITTAGRKQVIGRPILYKTTREFLLRFGLKDLNELPSIEEFEKMAGELAETEDAMQESDQILAGARSSVEDQQELPSEEGEVSESASEPQLIPPDAGVE